MLDLPEPWRVVPHAALALRTGGLYLSYVPTVPQVMQTVQALEQSRAFSLVETFETLLRTWNIKGRSVRPDHRMVAHSGFITVARKVDRQMFKDEPEAIEDPPEGQGLENFKEEHDAITESDRS